MLRRAELGVFLPTSILHLLASFLRIKALAPEILQSLMILSFHNLPMTAITTTHITDMRHFGKMTLDSF